MQNRNTNQRKIILSIMKDNYTHPTADEIYESARLKDEHISRGTIYRNLAFLVQTGEIQKISVPDSSDHYDITLKKHYHFCCSNCKKMSDIPDYIFIDEEKIKSQMKSSGYSITNHSLIFSGLCPECNS